MKSRQLLKNDPSASAKAISLAPKLRDLHPAAPAILDSTDSPGRPLDFGIRRFFESRLGHNFETVRIHTDSQAAASARDINALAYTAGSHIAFREGCYAPEVKAGLGLLAHELVHVVQQSSSRTGATQEDDNILEKEADSVAGRVLAPDFFSNPMLHQAKSEFQCKVDKGGTQAKNPPLARTDSKITEKWSAELWDTSFVDEMMARLTVRWVYERDAKGNLFVDFASVDHSKSEPLLSVNSEIIKGTPGPTVDFVFSFLIGGPGVKVGSSQSASADVKAPQGGPGLGSKMEKSFENTGPGSTATLSRHYRMGSKGLVLVDSEDIPEDWKVLPAESESNLLSSLSSSFMPLFGDVEVRKEQLKRID